MFANCRMKHAGILIWKGDWDEAEEELLSAANELKQFRPLQVTACTVRLADLKRRQGKWNEAEELLNKVESHPLKQLFSAFLFFDRQEYEEALDMLKAKDLKLEISDEAKDWLANVGYDVTFGARPLKRTIQKYLVNPLSQELLMDNFVGGDTINVTVGEKAGLVFGKVESI